MAWSSWTGLWAVDDWYQGFDDQAKPSTRYLARGASIALCGDDVSQYDDDLSAGAGPSLNYASPAARFDFSHPRTIGFRISINNTDTGTLFRHGAASPTRMDFNAANNLRAVVNNSVAGTLTLTGLDGTRDVVVVAWTSRANPDTTGAGDAVESTLHAWNVTNSTYERLTFQHAVSTAKAQTAFLGAADGASTSVFSGVITGIWFENRMQTGAEVANDWVTARTPPTTVLEPGHQGHPPEADTIDQQNNRQGPSIAWAADAGRRLIRRTLSPLVNDPLNTTPTWTAALLAADDPMLRGAPGDTSYRCSVAWRRIVPVPNTCTHVWCRLHIRSWVTAGAAVPLGLRVYSWSRPPGMALPADDAGAADPLVQFFRGVTITRDDSASPGEFTVIGLIPIARGRVGVMANRTCIGLGLSVDPISASANDANARIMVRAIHVVPAYNLQDGGMDFGLGG